MPPIPWAKVHGASTHFPIALTLTAAACDFVAVMLWSKPSARNLHAAGTVTLAFAAAGSTLAVVSGLFLTKGDLAGAADLGQHHRYAWPAFALLIGLATWRLWTRTTLTRGEYVVYLGAVSLLALLISATAYFGGELLQGG